MISPIVRVFAGVGDGHDAQTRGPFGKDPKIREVPGPGAARAMPPRAVPARHRFDLRDQAADFRAEALGRAGAFPGVLLHRRQKFGFRFRVEDRRLVHRRESTRRARANTWPAGTP